MIAQHLRLKKKYMLFVYTSYYHLCNVVILKLLNDFLS